MKVLVVEDELFSAERLKSILMKIDAEIEVLDVLTSVESCLNWFSENTAPDLILLDIHLEDGESFELFREMDIQTPVIFTTAYEKYALQAFKQNSVDYLLKPIVPEELEQAINKFKSRISFTPEAEIKEKKRFLVKKGSQLVSVLVSEIAYFKTENKLTYLITKQNEKHVIDYSLEQLVEVLNRECFYRINRSTILGIESVVKIHNHFNGRLKLELNPSESEDVFVSRDRVFGFKMWLDS